MASRGASVEAETPDEFADELAPHLKKAYRLALALLGRADQAEDALQEAALKAWRKRRSLRDPDALLPWFLSIVANECRRTRRYGWWRREVQGLPELSRQSDETGVLRSRDLQVAITRLRHEQRVILILHFYLDLRLQDVAEIVGVPLGTAKSRLARALAALRPLLEVSDV